MLEALEEHNLFLGIVISFFLNTVLMWVVVNLFIGGIYKSPLWRCAFAVFLLNVAVVVSCLAFFIPIIGFIVFLLALYKLSMIAIESALEINQGAFGIWFMFILVSLVTGYLV